MSAKEKAEELVNKFYNPNVHPNSVEVRKDVAKESALICVDKIIAELDSERVFERIYFWNEVKEEIISL
jgi:predicted adenine nucleotide alpha hydrolase (AANH) superfamily ATPase